MAVTGLIAGQLVTGPVGTGCVLVLGVFGGWQLGSVIGEKVAGKVCDIGA